MSKLQNTCTLSRDNYPSYLEPQESKGLYPYLETIKGGKLSTCISIKGNQGIALLEMAILIPIILILILAMSLLGQIYLSSSKINFIVDGSLRSFVLSESEGSWSDELNLLADELSARLLEISSNPPPKIMIALAKTSDDRIAVINGASRDTSRSTTHEISPIDLASLNESLIKAISNLRSQASGSRYADLTGLTLTRIILPAKRLPLDLNLNFPWPTLHQRLAFINRSNQF